MHAENKTRPLIDGITIVTEMRAVGGSHFAYDRSGTGHDLRDAKSIADFDQLAARDDHLVIRRQFLEHQIDGSSVVIDHNRRPAEEPLEETSGMCIAAAAFAGAQIVFEIRIAVYRRERRKRSAAQ